MALIYRNKREIADKVPVSFISFSKLRIHNSTTVKKVTEVLARCGNKWPEYTIHGISLFLSHHMALTYVYNLMLDNIETCTK